MSKTSKYRVLFNTTLDQLREVANADNSISTEEQAILDTIEEGAEKYFAVLDDAIQDGSVSRDESKVLRGLKAELLGKVEEIASRDGIISPDEDSLIKKLYDIITTQFRNY